MDRIFSYDTIEPVNWWAFGLMANAIRPRKGVHPPSRHAGGLDELVDIFELNDNFIFCRGLKSLVLKHCTFICDAQTLLLFTINNDSYSSI